jgi:hypothetical protein
MHGEYNVTKIITEFHFMLLAQLVETKHYEITISFYLCVLVIPVNILTPCCQ